MTLKELEKEINKKDSGQISRAGLVGFMCLKRGIKDEETITNYIVKAYTTPVKEFAGRRIRTERYGQREARKQIAWLKVNKLLK